MKSWIAKHSIALSLLLVVAVMAMIFGFSAQTGEESGAMSGRITTWVLGIVIPDFESMSTAQQQELSAIAGLLVRKLAHFSEYALLGYALLLHIRQIQKRITVRLTWLWAWSIGTLYAVTDELHQGLVAGRGPAVTDVLIDSAGVIAGVLLMLLCIRLKAKTQRGV